MQAREHYVGPRDVGAIKNLSKEDIENFEDFKRIGISFKNPQIVHQMMDSQVLLNCMYGQDSALPPTVTTASIGTPIQFLQEWLPGFVNILTGARKIDELVGIMTAGKWHSEEIVQGVMERTGTSLPYGDYADVPLSSWNVNFERRTVVRFEEGLKIGPLEEARASEMRVDSASSKREAAALALEIQRNNNGFYGFKSGANRTYGYLNDPALPAYVTVANGVSGSPLWANKTMTEITRDIRTAVAALRTQAQDTIDPEKTPMILACSTNTVDFLSTTSDFNVTAKDWLTKNYPMIRVVSAPQLNAANGGANVFYLYAERVDDMSTDDGRVFLQVVPATFMFLALNLASL